LVGRAPEQNHHKEHIGAVDEKVYQEVLMDPVDLSQQSPDAGARDSAGHAASGRESNLERHVMTDFLRCRRAEEQADTPGRDRVNIVAASVEERLDETLPFQAMGSRKREARFGGSGVVSHVPEC
jgi:hypothetical protein